MPQRKIFSQGDLDSACLLYALANAYTALTGQAPGCAAWDKGIAALPSARAFLQGCVGTSRGCYQGQELQEQVLESMLGCFSESGNAVHAEWHPGCRDVASMAELIGKDSVVVFRYHGRTAQVVTDDHWVCGVAVTTGRPLRLHLACSFRHAQDGRLNGQRYGERFLQRIGRYANDWVSPEHGIVIIPGSVYSIHRTEPSPIIQENVNTSILRRRHPPCSSKAIPGNSPGQTAGPKPRPSIASPTSTRT